MEWMNEKRKNISKKMMFDDCCCCCCLMWMNWIELKKFVFFFFVGLSSMAKLWYSPYTIHHTPLFNRTREAENKTKQKQHKKNIIPLNPIYSLDIIIIIVWVVVVVVVIFVWWWFYYCGGGSFEFDFLLDFFSASSSSSFCFFAWFFSLVIFQKKKSTIYTHYVYSGFASASKFTFFFFSLYVFCMCCVFSFT